MKTYYFREMKVAKIDQEKRPEIRALVKIGTFIRKCTKTHRGD